jgi:hypothetical protein
MSAKESAMSANRFSGTLALRITYVDRDDSYRVSIRARARYAVDSSEAYDAIARAALGFASYEDEYVAAYAEADSETGGFAVRRKL